MMGGLVCEHVVTRSVRDTAAILDVGGRARSPATPTGRRRHAARRSAAAAAAPPRRLRIGVS